MSEERPLVLSIEDLTRELVSKPGEFTSVALPAEVLEEAVHRGILRLDRDERRYTRQLIESLRGLDASPLQGVPELMLLVADEPSREGALVVSGRLRVAVSVPLLALEYADLRDDVRVLITRDTYPCDRYAEPFQGAAQPLPGVAMVPGPWRWTTARREAGEWMPTAHGSCFESFNDAIADAMSVASIGSVVDWIDVEGVSRAQ